MKNMLKKNWIWIFILVILLGGGYFALNNEEGMSLERLCYTRETDGARICVKGESSCTYFSDGTSKCTQGKNVCSNFTSCAECNDKNTMPLGGRCFWNSVTNTCSSKLEKDSSPSCNKNIGQMPAYLPVISLIPTTSLSNSAPIK